MSESLALADAAATEAAGAALAAAVLTRPPAVTCVFLRGDLGAGKTTFARGFVQGCGHSGRVPSPTYTLVEPYECKHLRIWHLDLYRLADGAEMAYLGMDEMLSDPGVLLIEWPERAIDYLPNNDLNISLEVDSSCRRLLASAGSEAGRNILNAWFSQLR